MQVGPRAGGHDRLVETDNPALTALLEQPGKSVRCHLSLGAADPAKVPSGALVHEQAARNVYPEHRDEPAVLMLQLHLEDVGVERRSHRVVADFANPAFEDIQFVRSNVLDPARLVVHSQDHRSAPAVGQGSQFVRDVVPVGGSDTAAGHPHALQLQAGILAKPDAAQEVHVTHGPPPDHRSDSARVGRSRSPITERPRIIGDTRRINWDSGPQALDAGSRACAPATARRSVARVLLVNGQRRFSCAQQYSRS